MLKKTFFLPMDDFLPDPSLKRHLNHVSIYPEKAPHIVTLNIVFGCILEAPMVLFEINLIKQLTRLATGSQLRPSGCNKY